MTKEKANKVYDLLVVFGGAIERERDSFIYHHCENKDGCREWRFRGKLGFGGKYYSRENKVTCYSEDETPERKETIKFINESLSQIDVVQLCCVCKTEPAVIDGRCCTCFYDCP